MSRPLVLVILDGFGLTKIEDGNAIAAADSPVFDRLFHEHPCSRLTASGEAVGLPEGQIGNSEVGHMNLGAGRTVYQPLVRINRSIETGDFFENEVLRDCIRTSRETDGTLHLIGLVSDGGVHSHESHISALLELSRRLGQDDVAVHAQLDGRDVPPRSAETYLENLLEYFDSMGIGQLATMGGRYYGMDRDERWDRTEKAYNAIVQGQADVYEEDPLEALRTAYEERDENDEFVTPTVFHDGEGNPRSTIDPGDGVVFFNFRPDRARQLTEALTDESFDGFQTDFTVDNFTCLTQYDEDYDLPVAFPPEDLENVLTDYLAREGLRQFHIAETEKYAHVTFFFNGGVEDPFPGEERKLIPSPKVSTYDKQPEMSALEVTDALIERLRTETDDFLVVNYANPDMVGHTGDFDAAVEAIEALDECLGNLLDEVGELGGEVLVTSDHGNAEQMVDPETGSSHTAHTLNDCPLIYVGSRDLDLDDGTLADVAPTLLNLLNLPIPEEMTGRNLVTVES
ncbi:MAG: 2,3-bisphosphoglycerate-independent phosphoglycerate mutase [bacterium]